MEFSGRLLFLLKLLLRCMSTQPSPLPSRRAAAALKSLSPALAVSSLTPRLISEASRLRLAFDRAPWELSSAQKSSVLSLLCDNSALEEDHVLPANTTIRTPGSGVRRRKPHLSSIHRGKIALHLLIIAFFRLKGRRSNRQPCKHERCSCCRN